MAAMHAISRSLIIPTGVAIESSASCYRQVSGAALPAVPVGRRHQGKRRSAVRAEQPAVAAHVDASAVSDATKNFLHADDQEASKVAQKAHSQVAGLRDTVWGQKGVAPRFPTLDKDLSVDVVVIGAGIAGLSIAYNLVKAGKSVAVLEGKSIGSGQTGKTTAHLMSWNDDMYNIIEKTYGKEVCKKVADSHLESIKFVEQVCNDENIDAEFKWCKGYLVPDEERKLAYDIMNLERETMVRHGVPAKDVDLKKDPRMGSFSYAVEIGGTADFHPLKYIEGLADAITKKGGKIYELSRVMKIDGNKVTTDKDKTVTAGAVVFATNSPSNHNLAIHTRQSPDRSYVVGLKLPKGSVEKAMWWDTHQPYHYVRIEEFEDYDVLVVGGEDHITGQHPDEYGPAYENLIKYARDRWTSAGEVLYKWTGQVYKPSDFLGIYGREPLDISGCHYVATGDSGQGMTGGTIAGLVISDLITKGDHKWADIFSPSRLPPPLTVPSFTTEAKTVTQGYAEVALPKDLHHVKDVAPGTGAVIAQGVDKVAVFRDEQGAVHQYSAICPHLKCLVQWNPVDTTFDCPCHGSQFDCKGRLVNGPAKADLSPYTPK